METTKTKKMSLLITALAVGTAAAAWLLPAGNFQAAMENDLVRELRKKLDAYREQMPQDKLYLQVDKTLCEPGDDIWFSAYVREGAGLKPSEQSELLMVDLIGPKGTLEKRLNLITKNGKAAGDLTISKEAAGGLYKIRAYTNWMKNEGEENYFEKEIQVQELVLPNLKMKLDFEKKAFGAGDEVTAKLSLNSNENKPLVSHPLKFMVSLNGIKMMEQGGTTDEEGLNYIKFKLPSKLVSNDGLINVMIDYNGSTESISRAIPIVLNSISLNLFPEGGDLLCGLENTIAFKALNEFGKPADIEGAVFTEKGSKVAGFTSFHQGMGAFTLIPQKGEKYLVKITKPEGIKETFVVPEAWERGYALSIDNSKQGEVAATVNTTETEQLTLVAQIRGKMVYSTLVNTLPGNNSLVFSTQDFPIGVAQLTLFDSKGIARAERLTFVNKHKQMNISVTAEKQKYLPREKIKMNITVKDERGMPMPANLSMAVVNDQLLTFADDKSGNIVSQLLLQQDLKEKIEEPAFYFDSKEKKADKALDYLLMTSGWRRFTWEKLMEQELPPIQFMPQKAILAGTVLDAQTGKPIPNVTIKDGSGALNPVNENGKFLIKKIDLSSPQTLTFNSEKYAPQSLLLQNYDQNLVVYLSNNTYEIEASWGASGLRKNVPAMQGINAGALPQEQLAGIQKIEIIKSTRPIRGARAPKPGALENGAENLHALQKIEEKEMMEPANNFLPLDDARSKVVVAGVEDLRFRHDMEKKNLAMEPAQVYYRTREFPMPTYEKQENVETRSDFRNTIYWNPMIEIGYSGKRSIEFFASDDITSFKATIEGIGTDGSVGRVEESIFTQLPFEMSAKIPVEISTEDFLSIPVTLKNNTDKPLGGILSVTAPAGLKVVQKIDPAQTIMPGIAKTIYFQYKVLNTIGYADFTVGFKSCGLSDGFTKKIKIAAKGFPSQLSFSSQEAERDYEVDIHHLVNGSLKASFTAFPNVVTDLMKGVEGILQEPYGCFEQTSCSAYPNAMVLDYLKTSGSNDSKLLARANDLLDRGYKRLTTFETSNKGYEWFGSVPAHEGLTAYGIMEFVDMQKAGQQIDQKMLDRTALWLLSHKDGKGGFERERRALHDFGRISDEVLNGYIVYAMAEAGYTDLKKEFETSYSRAMASKDAYLIAMASNAAFSLKENGKANEALKALLQLQNADGSFTGSSHSITYSQGQSLTIETTALSILAMLKSPALAANSLNRAVQNLLGARNGSGVFNSTQGTILALKALTEYAKFSKKANEDGTILIYVDNKKVAGRSYKAGDKAAIVIEGLEDFITTEGTHHLKVKYQGAKNPLPYSVAINYNTSLPKSDKECKIGISTKLMATTVLVGETVRLKTTLVNKSDKGVPSTMAIIGIPAGFSAQPWQLKELQEKKIFDFYEIKGNSIAFYYRGLEANSQKEINLDLKAEIPGEYEAPASCAYLYYTNEFKTWCSTERVIIKKT
ncbi:MAG: alpha-2-macroglobulin family protein [bacterium]|nr:alpha-2-macroglobulin family protein [bacterium]